MGVLGSRLTYGNFFRTGEQDCQNVMDPDEFEGTGTPSERVSRTWAEWERDGIKAQWLEQQDLGEMAEFGLDPDQCYQSWKDGWMTTAVAYLERDERRPRENPVTFTAKGKRMYQAVLASVKLKAEAQTRGARTTAGRAVLGAARRGVPGLVRKNPEDRDEAVEKYKEFHRYDPKRVEEIQLSIPLRVRKLGAAAHVLYRSAKVDPSTLRKPSNPVDYIHEHDAGVEVYACDGAADTDVPNEFRQIGAIVKLGKCLGFALKDGAEAEATEPMPDLCCTPDGTCLLIVQGKDKVLYMIWGGALGVFARGIDG